MNTFYNLHNALELYIELHPVRSKSMMIGIALSIIAFILIISHIITEIKNTPWYRRKHK